MDAVRPLRLKLPIGIHTDDCELHDDDVAGVALAIGARICACAEPEEILVLRTSQTSSPDPALPSQSAAHATSKAVGEWEVAAVTT
jgi:class 3 adenylate cyclase